MAWKQQTTPIPAGPPPSAETEAFLLFWIPDIFTPRMATANGSIKAAMSRVRESGKTCSVFGLTATRSESLPPSLLAPSPASLVQPLVNEFLPGSGSGRSIGNSTGDLVSHDCASRELQAGKTSYEGGSTCEGEDGQSALASFVEEGVATSNSTPLYIDDSILSDNAG
ncbi:hypothetical protein AYO21_02967 [Fonsecaea monophora]|uniref:Uncharacterized protein n=1 Tax=Fonsecaea monophora TaxID=254056 RepID=A0A177FEH2_9EURO|nr:hypothetical protein AYO21_02967 [Fonsecaea monophora]OAG42684.1 hypothetical protein AYO21_02967 [Fonsecaea monophora]